MAATTVDRNTPFSPLGELVSHPVAASTIIRNGVIVSFNTSGYLVEGTDTLNELGAGVALEHVDNSAGANGDLTCKVRRIGICEFAASGLAVTDVGKALFIVDNQTVGVAATTTNDVQIGTLAYFKSATVAPVALLNT